MLEVEENIEIHGARSHNLKNIDLTIPRNKLVVITGISGSGKSSLAFDTIYAEGQRRYIETFSAYARKYLSNLERPDVDKINGLSPVIAIEQKTTNRSPRSTVGTITEIYDFLRLMYAKIGEAYSYNTGKKMVSYNNEQVQELIEKLYKGKRIYLLAPLIKARKGHYRDLFQQIIKKGYTRARIDGEFVDLTNNLMLDRYKNHDIEIVIDIIDLTKLKRSSNRLKDSILTGMYHGENSILICDELGKNQKYFSKNLMCEKTGISYEIPDPNSFSFNSPKGACKNCNGIGTLKKINLKKLIPDDNKSISQGGIQLINKASGSWINKQIKLIGKKYGFSLKEPIKNVPKKALEAILYGIEDRITINSKSLGIKREYNISFEGIVNFIENQYKNTESIALRRWANKYMDEIICETCKGSRLKKESLYFKVNAKDINELVNMEITDLISWFKKSNSKLSNTQKFISEEIIKELIKRLQFLSDVGLEYLTLNRPSRSLSGGESQRIRLASQIGSQLVGVLYILDEPSIGLHQRDNDRLIKSLEALRDMGNSVIVVEHDKEMIYRADHIIDIGPLAGKEGGNIMFEGNLNSIKKSKSLTSDYLNNVKVIEIPDKRREGNGKTINLYGCNGNNLKDIDVSFPLNKMIGITGVSGSGKSSLINETLYPILNNYFYNGNKKILSHKSIKGIDNIDKVVSISQSPIGRTPRSNPATYCGVYSEIRNLFSLLNESVIRGYKPGRFSFNVKGGRCEECKGGGLKLIEMNFLPDVYVECENCMSKRFNRETLEIKYKGKSINNVLDMTINTAVDFFEHIPKIYKKLKTIQDVGLGYITLGQQSTTLSGGEAQRIKLASELSKRDTGNTMYILDEPTTGLHFEDIKVLMNVLNKLVDKGNTVLIIEHNMDVIKTVDHIIDIGPEGGNKGGYIIFEGTPEKMLLNKTNYTALYLKKELN